MAVQLFLSMDSDGSGNVSQAEWNAWQNTGSTSDGLFAQYDADSDGDIELSEYMKTYDSDL